MDDTKIKAIRKMPEGSKIFKLWIGVLCLAMKSGRTGCVEIGDGISFNAETLSNHFGIDIMTVTLALQTFERFKMIELFEDGTIFIKNFEKHQQLDKINENLEKTRKRVEKFRKKQKLLGNGVTVTAPLRNATDKDKESDKTKSESVTEHTPTFFSLKEFTKAITGDNQYSRFDMKYYYEVITNHLKDKKTKVNDFIAYSKKWMLTDLKNENAIFNPTRNKQILESK